MSNRSCCVVNCKKTSRKNDCKFYKFPTVKWKINQRNKWIAAVRRQNADGSPWIPKPYDYICSDHFMGGKKSEEEASPSYVPTIFPPIYKSSKVNESSALSRFKRLMDRQLKRTLPSTIRAEPNVIESVEKAIENSPVILTEQTVDQECQVNFYSEGDVNSQTFICNRYVNEGICYAEIQTEIVDDTRSIKINSNNKKFVSKACGTPPKKLIHQETQADNNFNGFESITTERNLIDLAGVTFENFEFLLKRMCTSVKCTVSKKDRLFIFLIKMKTGLTFSALGVLFCVHRTTISRIFFETLQHLAGATRNLVFWPNIDAVQETMPDCFHPEYSNTRVIIDCTEFKIEILTSVDNRVFTYSQYKKNFTAKVLVGITPAGFICLKSKVAGGRKSDSQLTIESGLLDLLENGDIVLADKGFPEIKTVIDTSGKKVRMVMPPFLEKNTAFSSEETQQTYSVARVRIHVERIMQRLRTYQILSKIPENLFHCIDDIMHICCVLVNLQPPIISNKNDKENGE
ncbi:uncharacterized protein [Venturia canescens]|uniref:uncharacterized protein n=1 Tax=Venturia canescens TaxID=32260 RepID=UPI001C9D0A91|nr:uncharacterized protein LOC122414240 [Venturia canescens]